MISLNVEMFFFFRCRGLKKFFKFYYHSVWIVFSVVVFFYISMVVFITIAAGFLTEKYSLSDNVAGTLVGLPYLISVIGAPTFGFLVDLLGFHLLWGLVSSVFMITKFSTVC